MAIKKPTTPEKAIRMKCLECCCGASIEVENCNLTGCPLFDFRMIGAKPAEKKEATNIVVDNNNSVVYDTAMLKVNVEEPVKKSSKKKAVKAKEPDEVIEPISKVDTGTGTICGEPAVIGETVTPVPINNNENGDDFDLDLDIDDDPVEIETAPEEPVKQTKEEPVVPDVTMPDIDIEESKPPIEDGHKFVVDLDKVERKEETKPLKKKKETKKKTEPVVEVKEQKKTEEKPIEDMLDDIDTDDLFDI